MIYLGVMSGTSLNSVDIAAADFANGVVPVAFRDYPIGKDLAERVRRLQTRPQPVSEAARLDHEFGRLFADCLRDFIRRENLAADKVAAVGLHGQTVLHRPDEASPYTLQIGDPNIVAIETGLVTVSDFRRMDLALGGQGAPLAPAFHETVFRQAGRHKAVVNIGGIANLTLLPADSRMETTGFDTGPGNCAMDAWSRLHLGLPFDRDGAWAASGEPDPALLAKLLADPFFPADAPKSACTAQFGSAWIEENLNSDAQAATVQATLAELTAASIAGAIAKHAPQTEILLVCGGGVHNSHLMARLSALTGGVPVSDTQSEGLAPDQVEALAFAWLAKQRLERVAAATPAITGARRPAVLGAVYRPPA